MDVDGLVQVQLGSAHSEAKGLAFDQYTAKVVFRDTALSIFCEVNVS